MHEGGFFGKGSLNICRNTLTSPYHMNLLELSSHLAAHKDLTNFKKYDWATSKYFFEDTFDFMNYSNTYVYKSKISPEKLEKVLKSNPNYVAEGFVQNWMDNAENKPIQNRIESEKLEVTYADNWYTYLFKTKKIHYERQRYFI